MDAARNGVPLNEHQARRIICTNLAEVLGKGNCTVRVRRLKDEGRVTFLVEDHNRWQLIPEMDYQGPPAEGLIQTLLAVGTKRTKDLHMAVHNNGNYDEVTIGFHKEAAVQHRGNLYQYVYGQLFRD